jgi:hypothetical protein
MRKRIHVCHMRRRIHVCHMTWYLLLDAHKKGGEHAVFAVLLILAALHALLSTRARERERERERERDARTHTYEQTRTHTHIHTAIKK